MLDDQDDQEQDAKQDAPPSGETKRYENTIGQADQVIQGDNPNVKNNFRHDNRRLDLKAGRDFQFGNNYFFLKPDEMQKFVFNKMSQHGGFEDSGFSEVKYDKEFKDIYEEKARKEEEMQNKYQELVSEMLDTAFSDEDEIKSPPGIKVPENDEQLRAWYVDLSDADQCFVQAMAVFSGAGYDEIALAYEQLHTSIREARARELARPTLSQSSHSPFSQHEERRRKSLSERMILTFITKRHVQGVDRLYWIDSDGAGTSSFGLRVLRFIADEEPLSFGDQSGQRFMEQLKKWANSQNSRMAWRAVRALGVIQWRNKFELIEDADKWASSERTDDLRRAAYLVEGAYEIDLVLNKSVANDHKKSDYLRLIKKWVEKARNEGAPSFAWAAAITYASIVRTDPEIALSGLDTLLELSFNDEEEKIWYYEDVYRASTINRFEIALNGYMREVLQHIAKRSEDLVYKRPPPKKMTQYERQRTELQRQFYLESIKEVFIDILFFSFNSLKDRPCVVYSLTKPLPRHPRPIDYEGKEVLLMGILSQKEQLWRSNLRVLFCTIMIEFPDLNRLVFSYLRFWTQLVMDDQSAKPDLVRLAFVHWMGELAKTVDNWYQHLKSQDFHPPDAPKAFRREIESWRMEGKRRKLPIELLAQEILDQLSTQVIHL